MDGLINALHIYKAFFVFHHNKIKLIDVVVDLCVYQLHKISLKSDENHSPSVGVGEFCLIDWCLCCWCQGYLWIYWNFVIYQGGID